MLTKPNSHDIWSRINIDVQIVQRLLEKSYCNEASHEQIETIRS